MISVSILDVTNKDLSLTDKIKIIHEDKINDTIYKVSLRYTDIGPQIRAYKETEDPDDRLIKFVLLGTKYSPDFIIIDHL